MLFITHNPALEEQADACICFSPSDPVLDESDDEDDINSLHMFAQPDELELQPGHAQFAGASSSIKVRSSVLYLHSATSLALGAIA